MSFKAQIKTRNAFGATAPPFIDYLKDILRRYPDGGQILKELIQNADDAEATKVVFIHDERGYGNESLFTADLGKYQGPALYAYNDAAFTDDDWSGIQAAGRSVKRKDPNKVGRFGIGFNSVYHITDAPSILSSGHLALLDPQEKLFGRGNGGIQWSLSDTDDQETLMTLEDQFKPFQDIVSLISRQKWRDIIMEDHHFNGTLFRFPLRGEMSEISENLYDGDKVVELFESFITDADLIPLFLKNVTSVSLIHVRTDSSVDVRLEVTSSCSAGVVLESGSDSIVKSSTGFKNITLTSQGRRETKQWLVTTCCMKEGNIADLDSLAEKLSFLPEVDLAFPCGPNRDCADSRLSCFLPLPNNESNKTGLPVYVNACFGLTDNRRHIKWQEEDQKYDEAALWNELLVKEVLPPAYLRILQDAIQLSKDAALPVSSVYGLWPDIEQVEHKDKWNAVALDVLQQLFRGNFAVLSLAADERSFVPAPEAVLPCDESISPAVAAVIQQTLVSCGENLVSLPEYVARAIREAYPHPDTLRRVTPALLRASLCGMNVHNLSAEDKVSLLEYVLSDEKYGELRGLPLLPLSDGTFRSFTDREEDVAFIDSEEFPRALLPGCQNLFIPEDLNMSCSVHLQEIARRNLFRVLRIGAHQVMEYAKRYLPLDWKQENTRQVTWERGNNLHPPAGWLQEFWRFLHHHFRELSGFSGMPLIPISPPGDVGQPMLLARLQQNTTLIFQKSKQISLPDQIAKLVTKVGGTVVRGGEWLKHEDLDSYVLHPSPGNVMQVFVNLGSQDVVTATQAMSHQEREELKNYLSSLDRLSGNEKHLLLHLPLFRTVKGSYVAAFSKQAVLFTPGLTVPTELPMPDSVVRCATEADRRLLGLLCVTVLDTSQAADLLVDCIKSASFKKDDIEKTMSWVLEHGSILFSQNTPLKRKCTDLNFIAMNGELKKTDNFLDPRVETFRVLFEPDFFPPAVYTRTPQMLNSLTELGLLNKEEAVTSSHLLHAAKQIDKLHFLSPNEAVKRFPALLRLLDANDTPSKLSKQQLDNLLALKWVPCVEPSTRGKQPRDISQRRVFFCPHEIRHLMYEDIVGYVMPLTGELSEKLSDRLGLKHLPPPDKVLENLSVLSSVARTLDEPDRDGDFKRRLHSIYKHMQDHSSEFTKVATKDRRWFWAHNQFVSPQDLVLNYPPNLDLSAYIGKVPQEFLTYSTLLRQFGLRQSLSEEEIVGILYAIKETIEGRQLPVANSSELKISISILNWVWREKKAVTGDIPVPVIAEGDLSTLQPLSTTVFCDISKDGLESLKYGQEVFYVIHEEMPKATAEWLKIPLLSTRILRPELVGIQQCGQSEPITMRIKNILNEYDEENDIFKELIQNAEDARASVCRFMVDFRVHTDTPDSLFDPGMSLCHGPCLWTYNDELFTEDDWGNILRVGSASKENMVEKIGKFGLGFNTVYHVTDCPSILSGNSLLILDPNVTHLKKHIRDKTNPGIKLDLSHQPLLQWFPGQFRPYENVFDCSFTRECSAKPYRGTLIKLPFRTQEEASKSELSKKVYDTHNIITFQQHFVTNSNTHLLFLKNINTVSLQNIKNNASTPPRDDQIQTVVTVSKTAVSTLKIPDETYLIKQTRAVKGLMSCDKKCNDIIDCHRAHIVEIKQEEGSGSTVQFWLLYNCFGTQRCLQMLLEENKQTKFSLPIGGVAVPLDKDPETGKWITSKTEVAGQAFCFLPLSIQTGLPLHVNGAFAVTSNRKGLWSSGVKHDWNKALLQDPAQTAYVTALLVLKAMSQHKHLEDYLYYTFWPNREKVTETFKPLVDAFYSAIASDAPELFSNGKHWCCIKKAIFLHESIEEDKKISALAMEVCENHVKGPNRVIPLPLWLRNSLRKAGFEAVLQSRTWDWEEFYREVVINNITTMDPKSRNALVLHAIDLNINAIDKLLMCHPCIPTQGGQLQYIKKLVNPAGKVARLFEQTEGRLLEGTSNDYCTPKRIQRLLELGMLNDHLPLEEITERVGKIACLWSEDKTKAYTHLKCILALLRSPQHDKHSKHWKSLRKTAFLPASPPLSNQKDQMVTLRKPTDVFNEKCRHLVNMTQPVMDHSNLEIHSADPVLQILGVCENPTPEMVLQQLEEASKQSQLYSQTVLHKIANECYTFLDQRLHDCKDTRIISERAHSFPFILVGNKFVRVKYVAEYEEFEAKPYLHVLPMVFTSFRRLWECVGLEKKFTVRQFLTTLQKLHDLHGTRPLPKPDLTIFLAVLLRGIYETKEKIPCCLIPNQHCVLQPATELYFNDSPWMQLDSGVTLCHDDITRKMARHFGIKTTKHQTLENHLVENISPFEFEFKQHEKLTVRIKNIIAAYPSKKDILKELLQNADDAGATEIHLVWDQRRHGTKKTFGDKWNQLQGPALCVYNNKVFSDADLNGIQQLGEGGKHSTPGKTGKYGIGFNSVYHLTDCPSILTGDKLLCISDPNQKYIECTSKTKISGRGYNFADVLKEMYKDVYESFLPEDFKLEEGTMFRLPLRTATMAESSKISDQAVTDRDISELFSALRDDPEGLIIFLKHIQKIQLHEIGQPSGALQNVFTVVKNLPETSIQEKLSFEKHRQDALQPDPSHITPRKIIYKVKIATSDNIESEWIIAQQFGIFNNIDRRRIKEEQGNGLDKLPQAALAACVSCKPAPRGEQYKGGVFCTLPLPGKTGLPIHVDGNFEVDSSRRDLWKEDGLSLKRNWNGALKQNVIAPLYADLLHYIHRGVANIKTSSELKVTSLDSSYICFFPVVTNDVPPDWQEMIHEVYRSIRDRDLDVIPVLKSKIGKTKRHGAILLSEYAIEWCNVRETEVLHRPYLIDPSSENLNDILQSLGMRLVPFSARMVDIWRHFHTEGVDLKTVSPSTVGNFLREKPLNDPSKTETELPLPIDQTLIKNEATCSKLLSFCLKDVENDKSCSIQGLPLLLTNDKVLRVFDASSPKLITRYNGVFLGYDEDFAHYSTNSKHMEVLQDFVKDLTIPDAVKYLKPILLSLLENCEVDPLCSLHVRNEATGMWLKDVWKFLTSQISSPESDKQCMTLSTVKELFHDCCMLPVVCPRSNNKHFLRAMKDMPSVIHLSSKEDISSILFKLGTMKLDTLFFFEMGHQVHALLNPELMHPSDQGAVMDQLFKLNHLEFGKLSQGELNELQVFLQSGVSKSERKEEYTRKLKSLPLFETVHGERVRIDGPSNVFILHTNSIAEFPDLFKLHTSDGIFLSHSLQNQCLSEILKVGILSDVEYFLKFILPAMRRMTERQIIGAIKMLLSLQYCLHESKHQEIVSLLKNVKLIRSANGHFEMASYYFDENVPLYKMMLPEEKFVPQRFWNELGDVLNIKSKAKDLLIKLGMKHAVSVKEVIHFAHQIESESNVIGDIIDLKRKSSMLLKTAMTMAKDDDKQRLLVNLADIKFISPVEIRKDLCDYHRPFVVGRTTVALRGSLIESEPHHQDLIWTSIPIIALPYCSSQKLKEKIRDAGAFEKPPDQGVTRNISNICQLPCQTEDLINTRATVFRHCYAHLQTDAFEGDALAGLPIVLVENNAKLVKAEEASLGLPDDHDFRPYLYKIPRKDMRYSEFFLRIGVSEVPTVQQYCQALTAVHCDSCDKSTLNANQMQTVRRAVQKLFSLIDAQENLSAINICGVLYLPSRDGRLYPSNTLYFNDTVFQASRLETALEGTVLLLEKLNACYLVNDKYAHLQQLRKLPQDFRPKMLSQSTEETLVDSQIQICDYGTDCEFSGWFGKHLSSPAFRHGLICLIRQKSEGKTTQEDAADMCEKAFGSIQIVCCKRLETVLCFEQQPLNQTGAETEVYVREEHRCCTFYLQHNDDMTAKVINEIILTLTKEINALLGNTFPSSYLTVLGQLLMCDNIEEVSKTLAKNEIHDSAEMENSLLYPPQPGSAIPEEWLDSMDMNFLNNYEEGEYIGYSSNDTYTYAIIVERLPGPPGSFSCRYKVQTGPEELIEVSSIECHQFKREKNTRNTHKYATHPMRPTALVAIAANASGGSSSSTRTAPASLEEAKKEIDRCLAEVWHLPEDERHKAIKRLFLRWHPDKNPDCQQLATEAFKYLKNRIEELTNGKTEDFSPRWNWNFRDFYDTWDQEARRHRRGRERFNRRHNSYGYNFWTHHQNIPRPNTREAQRWLRQARCDLAAASKDTANGNTEWCLFKVHQAVEKALIAAEFKRNGKHPDNSAISAMAGSAAHYSPQLSSLPERVERLKRLGVDAKKTQYPNFHPSPHIPNGRFRSEDELPATGMASELVRIIELYVN